MNEGCPHLVLHACKTLIFYLKRLRFYIFLKSKVIILHFRLDLIKKPVKEHPIALMLDINRSLNPGAVFDGLKNVFIQLEI